MNNKKLLKYLEERVELKNQDKVELSAKKVKLSLVNDLSSGLGEASRWESEIKNMGTSADKFISEFKKSAQKKKDVIGTVIMYQDRGNRVMKGLEILINKFEQATKELGIKPNSIDEYKIAQNVLEDLKDAIKKMEVSERELKQIK